MIFWTKLKSFFSKRKLDAEMAEELRLHAEQRAQENIDAGMSVEEARFAARRSFGGVEQVKESVRAQRGFAWLEQFFQDLKFAFRSFSKARTFTAVAALVLALGIGVNTALFSFIHAAFIDPYPYAKAQEMWVPQLSTLNQAGGVDGLQIGEYLGLAALPAVAQAMAANPEQANLGGGINPEIVRTVHMSGSAFGFLGVVPLIGRTIGAGDIQANGDAQPVAVLSYKLWQRRFDGDAGAIGRTLTLNDVTYTVIGVMPPRFGWFTDDGLWLPQATTQRQRGTNPLVRLQPGVSKEIAEQQIHAYLLEAQKTLVPASPAGAARAPAKRFPSEGFRVRLENFSETTTARARSSLSLLLFAGGFLQLIACTNVANLQLARGAMRAREIAIRLALGASRGRVVRQLLAENAALAALGGGLGVVLAFWLTRLVVLLLPTAYLPVEARVELNGLALGVCVGLAAITGILAGLVPAVQCTRPALNEALKAGGAAIGLSGGNRRTRSGLVVAQVGISVLLLTGAMLAIRGFVQQRFFDPGFQPERALMLRVPLTPLRYRTTAERNGFTVALLERMGRLPGVVAVAAGTLPGSEGTTPYAIPGQTVPDGARLTVNAMSSDYLAALGLPLLAGRTLTEQEIAFGDPVALINASAEKLWTDGTNPIGRTLQIAISPSTRPGARTAATPDGKRDVTVVGIVGDIRSNGLRLESVPGMFVPYTVRGGNQRLLIVRAQQEPLALLHAVRTELRALDPTQPLDQPVTWEELQDRAVAAPRFNLALFNGLAAIALALTGAGIYSVLSYSVVERTRELGVRVALGATHGDVVRLIVGEGGRLLLAGLVIGLVVSVMLAKLMRSQVFAVPLLDPVAFGAALGILSVVALLACYVPARRATKVDPMVALRCE